MNSKRSGEDSRPTGIAVDADTMLICPACRGMSLRPGRVDAYTRTGERGSHATFDGEGCSVDDEMAGNPSREGRGLTVVVKCAHCDAGLVLCLAEYKGSTLVYWEVWGDRHRRLRRLPSTGTLA
jgi:hypothetical protein